VIDVGFVQAVKDGLITIRPALKSLTSGGVVFADGKSEPYDAVIAATGFRTGLPELLGTNDVLNHAGEPLAASGSTTSQPGLFFTGFTHSLRGHLFEANLASKRLAKNVRAYLDS
jgi:hypothetical protein